MDGRLSAPVEPPFSPRDPAADRRHQRGVEEQVHGHTHGGVRGGDVVSGVNRLRV